MHIWHAHTMHTLAMHTACQWHMDFFETPLQNGSHSAQSGFKTKQCGEAMIEQAESV